MEKKNTFIILGILLSLLIAIAIIVIVNGAISMEDNYILLEVNPKVEFVTDKNNIVTSFKGLNNEADTLLIEENYIGLKIENAIENFLDLCSKANYIDVDGNDNVIKLTVVDGLTQALDVKIIESVNKYLKSHEILCGVVENANDLNTYKEAKSMGVTNLNKYRLIKNIIDYNYTTYSVAELKKMKEKDLIDIVKTNHDNHIKPVNEELITNKVKLIDFNRDRYDEHMNKITNDTQVKFGKSFDKYKKEHSEYKVDFDSIYEDWYQENKI